MYINYIRAEITDLQTNLKRSQEKLENNLKSNYCKCFKYLSESEELENLICKPYEHILHIQVGKTMKPLK